MTFTLLEAVPLLEGVAQSYLQVGLVRPPNSDSLIQAGSPDSHKLVIVPRVGDRDEEGLVHSIKELTVSSDTDTSK